MHSTMFAHALTYLFATTAPLLANLGRKSRRIASPASRAVCASGIWSRYISLKKGEEDKSKSRGAGKRTWKISHLRRR
jgi:hypothetical protein